MDFLQLQNYFNLRNLKMHKSKYYKAPKPQVNPYKKSKPKAQWTTDFSDPNKYKLSQAEMIQRKAALQSKNREVAKEDLRQRRKKLEMGIVDQDTRKVYQTALTSKNIDLNPPIRKNLSQMIQYEKERKEEERDKNQQNQEGDQFEKEIKQTQHFIKKLQKAKKQTKIEKAMDILLDQPQSKHFGPTKYTQILEPNINEESQQKNMDHSQALSSIEDTIKFMELKLFGSKKQSQEPPSIQIKQKEEQNTSKNEFLLHEDEPQPEYEETLQLSHFKMNIQVEEDEDNECMSTIRRMKQMIQSKDNFYSFEKENYEQQNYERNKNTLKYSEGEEEVDFSLTMNEDECKKYNTGFQSNSGFHSQYEEVKKNLFEEVDKLNTMSFDNVFSKKDNTSYASQQEPIQTLHRIPQENNHTGHQSNNNNLQQLKNMIHSTKTKVQNIRVEEINTSSSGMRGFDFRGSINIKKNLIKH